jgi:hypothetical protein
LFDQEQKILAKVALKVDLGLVVKHCGNLLGIEACDVPLIGPRVHRQAIGSRRQSQAAKVHDAGLAAST